MTDLVLTRRAWKHGTVNGYNYHKCRCPECTNAKSVYDDRWRQLNPGKVKASKARRSDKQRADYARWRKLNASKVQAYKARWRKSHPDKTRAYSALRRQRYPDEEKAYSTLWRSLNKGKLKATLAKYYKSEHGKQVMRLQNYRRRARKNGAAGFCTKEQLEARIALRLQLAGQSTASLQEL